MIRPSNPAQKLHPRNVCSFRQQCRVIPTVYLRRSHANTTAPAMAPAMVPVNSDVVKGQHKHEPPSELLPDTGQQHAFLTAPQSLDVVPPAAATAPENGHLAAAAFFGTELANFSNRPNTAVRGNAVTSMPRIMLATKSRMALRRQHTITMSKALQDEIIARVR